MTFLDERRPTEHPSVTRPNGLVTRLRLTGRAAVVGIAAFVPCALLPLWATAAALTPLTVVAPLLVPATWLVRRYADAHRRSAARVLGEPVGVPYAELDRPGMIGRVVAILRDPASWRDALWLMVHAVVASALSLLSVTLLLSAVFYLIFPFLWAVTPPAAFGEAFGVITVDSLGTAFALVPLAAVAFGLWWVSVLPCARVVARVDRSLLRPRVPRLQQGPRYPA